MPGTFRLLIGTVVIALVAVGASWAIQARRSPAFASAAAAVASPRWQQGVANEDSVTLGRMAYRECHEVGEPCYQAFLLTLADSHQIKLAMGTLSVIAHSDERVRGTGHNYAHAIGMRGYDPDIPFGDLFLSCSVAFQSGCYHGLIQVHLTGMATIERDRIGDFCTEIPGLETDYWLRFQCAHGLGHGLLMAYNHDLPRGLAGCDFLNEPWDRESCYGGAFMENVIATETHHMPVRATAAAMQDSAEMDQGMESHDDHGDTKANGEPEPPTFPRINPADPYYPCSVLHEHYQASCYGMQTSIMLELTEYDWRQVGVLCAAAPEAVRTTCYQSMGTNISGFTVRNAQESVKLCLLGNPIYQPWCFFGVAKNFIDVTSIPADGVAFCRKVPDGDNRLKCFQAIGEELAVLYSDRDRRVGGCASLKAGDLHACQFGAGLAPAPPPDLPLVPSGS